MSASSRRLAIFQRFNDGFVDNDDAAFFPVQYENATFSQPNGCWGRLTILEGTRMNASVGKEHTRTPGLLVLQIFTPDGSGSKTARAAADLMGEVFDNLDLPGDGGIVFRVVSFESVGLNKGGLYQHNASVEFYADSEEIPGEAGGQTITVTDSRSIRFLLLT